MTTLLVSEIFIHLQIYRYHINTYLPVHQKKCINKALSVKLAVRYGPIH